jgi:NAD-dependent dihydropyrimidine dehydrogenase PreA subunit
MVDMLPVAPADAVSPCTCSRTTTVLLCSCTGTSTLPDSSRQEVLTMLGELGVNLVETPDLCGMAARRDPQLSELVAATPLKIVACYPRAIRWLLHSSGIELPEGGLDLIGMREQSLDEIRAAVLSDLTARTEAAEITHIPAKEGWVPWFPVIDYDRCTGCQQCASFCLFGVFETSPAGETIVANPASCKTNCPACARVCPEAAIIFPKLDEAPINGAEVTDELLATAKVKVDVEEMLGDDLYTALAERRRKAKRRLLRRKALEQAHSERTQCSCMKEKEQQDEEGDTLANRLPLVRNLQ